MKYDTEIKRAANYAAFKSGLGGSRTPTKNIFKSAWLSYLFNSSCHIL